MYLYTPYVYDINYYKTIIIININVKYFDSSLEKIAGIESHVKIYSSNYERLRNETIYFVDKKKNFNN